MSTGYILEHKQQSTQHLFVNCNWYCIIRKNGASVTGNITSTGRTTGSNFISPSLQLSSSGHDLTFNSNDCFSYSYSNELKGLNRIFTMLSAAPNSIYFSVTSTGNTRYTSMSSDLIATSPLQFSSWNTTANPLLIQSSPTSTIFTVDQSFSLTLSGSITSGGNSVVTSPARNNYYTKKNQLVTIKIS